MSLVICNFSILLFQNRFRFTGECNHPDAQIKSCQTAGTQFLITNQKFNITYKKCPGMKGTFDGCNRIYKICLYILRFFIARKMLILSRFSGRIQLLGRLVCG